jgi:MFS family permease
MPARERAAAIATWSGAAALTTAFGPLLGGWLVDSVSWRAIFLINLPIAAVVIWLARGISDKCGPAAAGRLDWPGAVLAAAGLGALTYGIIEVPAREADARVLACIVGGAALLAAFVAAEALQPEPMLPLAIFRSARFSGANVLTLLLYFALTGVLFQLPFLLINRYGYSASAAGAALLPLPLLLGGLSRSAGRLAERVGPRLPLVAGPLLAALGFLLLGIRAGDPRYWTGVLPGMLALAGGMTLAVAPLTAAVMAAAPDGQAGVASGINNAVARVAGLLAVAVLGALAANTGNAIAGFQHVAYASAACAAAAAAAAASTIGPQSLA